MAHGGPTATPANTPKAYNDVFEKFVEPEDKDKSPLYGFIAYGLYKWAKREWMIRHCAEHNGTAPTPAEIAIFSASWNEAMVEGKRIEAEKVLEEFANFVVSEAKPTIEKDALRGLFWHEVQAGLLVAVIWTGVLILVALALKLGGIDVAHFYEGLGPTPH